MIYTLIMLFASYVINKESSTEESKFDEGVPELLYANITFRFFTLRRVQNDNDVEIMTMM